MTLIIAEAGVNHNGSEDLAIKLVDAAFKAGADIVKFQTFKASELVTNVAPKAPYQTQSSEFDNTQLGMLERLELSFDSHLHLLRHCEKLGIEFLSTAFDSKSLEFLVHDLGLKKLKIPSGEITNAPFVLEHARTGCDLIISTGLSTLAEVESMLGVVAFGFTSSNECKPTTENFTVAYGSEAGQRALKNKVHLLHCTTEYPAPFSEINLTAMKTLAEAFKLPVGYSDHSKGINVPIAAVSLGASIIEKHFTLDKSLEGPDHNASLNPAELELMITGIRNIEVALGDGVKRPTISEIKNITAGRKSLVANQVIEKGDAFTSLNVAIKRPGTGLHPYKYWDILGKSATKSYAVGDLLGE